MEKFMLIFFEGDTTRFTSQQREEQLRKWFAWIQSLIDKQRYVSGEALAPYGKIVWDTNRIVDDMEALKEGGSVGGFFIILAEDLSEASELARDCPDLGHGGIVEVRPIKKF